MSKAKAKSILPPWISSAYIIMAVVLSPWMVYLASSLPTHYLSSHWDISWVGLDIGITLSIFITGILAKMRSKLLAISSTMTGTFLLIDAWFDVTTSTRGTELKEALILAILFEIPIALMSLYIAYKSLISNK
jgi:hypothetical protein